MPRRTLFLLLAAVKIGVLVAIVAPTVPAFSADGVPSGAPATATAAAAFAPSAEAFDQADATFRRASDGDRAAIAPALAQFTALLQARPGDPRLMAYAGAATAMQARTTWLPWKKIGHAEDGLALIDRALARLTLAHDAERLLNVCFRDFADIAHGDHVLRRLHPFEHARLLHPPDGGGRVMV